MADHKNDAPQGISTGINTGKGINTRLAHMGHNPHDFHGFVNPPIYRGSTVLFPDAETMVSRKQAYTYGTHGTPTHTALENAINELEGSSGTVLVPSGLAAVTLPLLAYAEAGTHMLLTDSIYHPTRRFADMMLKKMGVDVEYYAPTIGADIERLMRPNTRVVFTEAPASNTFEMQDISAIADVARAHNAVTMMDNTYATPLFFKPLDHGVDISIHAATKYPAGHADILLGTVSANDKAWGRIHDAHVNLGVCAHPEDVYLVLRGLRTMGIRLQRHEVSTLDVSSWLLGQKGVRDVLNPALPHDPGHALFKRGFCGSTSVFSIVLEGTGDDKRDTAKAHAFLNALKLFGLGYSWGGYESLAVHVWLGDRTVSRRDYGGPVIRLQIGLEDTIDLKEELSRSLAAANAV